MTAVLMGLEPTSNRRIYLADSFKGLPKDTDVSKWKSGNDMSSVLGGRIKSSLHGEVGQFNTSRESFESNMAATTVQALHQDPYIWESLFNVHHSIHFRNDFC